MNASTMQSGSRPAFQQAGLRVEKLEEFEQLQSGLRRIFAPKSVATYLRLLQRKGVPVRDFERVLSERLLEAVDATLSQGNAKRLYEALSVSDQSQIRELYLTALEDVELSLREKYNKLYRYY
jgi:hypothetical protein